MMQFVVKGRDQQCVFNQNSINALESQSYTSGVLAGILALQKSLETKDEVYRETKDEGIYNALLVTTALAN